MEKERLAAFSDGVIAVALTIMVLELKAPEHATFEALLPLWSTFFGYVISFLYIAIYWNNHHHMISTVKRVDGLILWANMHLLFWLTLIPFATAWIGANRSATAPTAVYGFSLLMPAIAYFFLQKAIIRSQGQASILLRAIGNDIKGKISPVIYAAAIALAFVKPLASDLLYIVAAMLWLIPDRRIERLATGAVGTDASAIETKAD